MRGALAVSLGLIGLQVLLTSSLNNLIPAAAYLTTLAGKWIDPNTPLIPQAGTTSTAGQGNAGTKPAAGNGLSAASIGGIVTTTLGQFPL